MAVAVMINLLIVLFLFEIFLVTTIGAQGLIVISRWIVDLKLSGPNFKFLLNASVMGHPSSMK